MNKKTELYDISAELDKEFGAPGTELARRLFRKHGRNIMPRFFLTPVSSQD